MEERIVGVAGTFAATTAMIEEAEGLLREAHAPALMREYFEPGHPYHGRLSDELTKCLTLARRAAGLAIKVEEGE